MDDIQFIILEILYNNNTNVIKNDGWGEHKIRKMTSLNKEDVRVALTLLSDKKLITLIRHPLGKPTNIAITYRINQRGIEEYEKSIRPISC